MTRCGSAANRGEENETDWGGSVATNAHET